mmetsp:Transcript_10181/g.33318  ORF Transcript_10181/g.33318 Transcript_10181/m.33318 type:complete len:161 (+) Transcript_10181:64-546(+)
MDDDDADSVPLGQRLPGGAPLHARQTGAASAPGSVAPSAEELTLSEFFPGDDAYTKDLLLCVAVHGLGDAVEGAVRTYRNFTNATMPVDATRSQALLVEVLKKNQVTLPSKPAQEPCQQLPQTISYGGQGAPAPWQQQQFYAPPHVGVVPFGGGGYPYPP